MSIILRQDAGARHFCWYIDTIWCWCWCCADHGRRPGVCIAKKTAGVLSICAKTARSHALERTECRSTAIQCRSTAILICDCRKKSHWSHVVHDITCAGERLIPWYTLLYHSIRRVTLYMPLKMWMWLTLYHGAGAARCNGKASGEGEGLCLQGEQLRIVLLLFTRFSNRRRCARNTMKHKR